MKTLETKIPPPVIALAFGALIWWLADYLPSLDIDFVPKMVIVAILSVIGIFFDFLGLLKFRKAKTTVNPLRPHSSSALVNSGVYRVTRNPMYVGLAFLLCAWCVYLNSPVALLCVLGFIFYIQTFQIVPEERALVELFGEEFTEYQSKVRRWL